MGYFGNPAQAVETALREVEEQAYKYYGPYIEAGATALPTVMDEYMMLINEPGNFWAELGAGFEESPGYQYQYNTAMNASTNAAASGGMSGTQAHQQYASATANDLAAQEYNRYMQNMKWAYETGLTGMQGINKMGYEANVGMATSMGNLAASLAKAGFAGYVMTQQLIMQALGLVAGIKAGPSEESSSLMDMAVGGTVGYITGGPAGAAAGVAGATQTK